MGKGIRHWISYLAVFSVLLHSALLIGHNNSVLNAVLSNPLVLDNSTVCGEISLEDLADNGLPGSNKNSSKCPVCLGAAPAVALADVVVPMLGMPSFPGVKLINVADVLAPRSVAVLPPSRGPPAAA